MPEFPARDIAYVIRVDEIVWGGLLLALSIAMHGIGTFQILRATNAFAERTSEAVAHFRELKIGIVILAVWMIVLLHLSEIAVWAGFFVWKEAQPNVFAAFYNAMLNYTTLQAGYLPLRWRLLEGMLGMTGLLTFAWSTTTLFSLAPKLIEEALQAAAERREERASA
ncbi:MAG TPA: hypothetical protein VMN79_20680 [Casimicrobiaceae bacterium]|nr:hypothetical protein [Casimicrobiaceae bacterium]